MATKKGGLGKGLEAIFADNATMEGDSASVLRTTELEPNRNQPRRQFEQESLVELAESISAVGIIQPLIVRPIASGGYQIVAGERRWRAAHIAGLQEIPVIIRDLTDRDVAEFALVENLQREDLNPVEEAEGYRNLMREYGLTQEQVSQRVGKSRPVIANAVRLLDLPESVVAMLEKGDLSPGHARPLLGVSDAEEILRLAEMVVRRKMTAREVEKAVKNVKKSSEKNEKKPVQRSGLLDEIELALGQELARKIKVTGTEQRGILEIPYFSIEELADMANRLARDN